MWAIKGTLSDQARHWWQGKCIESVENTFGTTNLWAKRQKYTFEAGKLTNTGRKTATWEICNIKSVRKSLDDGQENWGGNLFWYQEAIYNQGGSKLVGLD